MRILQRLTPRDKSRLAICSALVVLVSLLHYSTSTEHLELHDLFEHLYYVPILLIAFWYGPWAGVGFALMTSGIYLIHIVKDLAEFTLLDPLTHLLLFNLMALLVGFLSRQAHRNLEYYRDASSELRHAYQELKNSSESLERSERLAALGQLSAGIAHEIRNPLGSIKGAVDILTSEIPSGHPKGEFVTIAKQEIARINKLIEEFLRFARPSKPRVQSVDLCELVSSAVRLVEGHADRQGVRIVSTNCDCILPVDPDQIRQVLLNLLLNAIEAMPDGGTLKIALRQDTPKRTTLEISDTGGDSESVRLDRIFDPFYTTKPHGTGLGLSISHQLVRNHGGDLLARRNEEGGLTFSVQFSELAPEAELSRAG